MPVYAQETRPYPGQQRPLLNSPKDDANKDNAKVPSASRSPILGDHGRAPPLQHPFQHTRSDDIKLEPLKMPVLQSRFIDDTMNELKERAAKRRRIGEIDNVLLNNDDDDRSSSVITSSSQFDIFEELDAHPDAMQFVANTAGLITYRNGAFAKTTKPSGYLQQIPHTIFDLVESKYLPSLYNMLALALHNNIGIVKVENCSVDDQGESSSAAEDDEKASSPSHLSVSLPCRSFCSSSTRYTITVVYMNDIAPPMKPCFLGILTPRVCNDDDGKRLGCCDSPSSIQAKEPEVQDSVILHKLPYGKILRLEDELLCGLLLRSA